MEVRRLTDRPIIAPDMADRLTTNINGPSLVKSPEWEEKPLGQYYLYFADHGGSSIRLAYADDLRGPWTLHERDPLTLDDAGSGFDDHIASPDVHVDCDSERVRMYYHGAADEFTDPIGTTHQYTRLGVSRDGLSFETREEPLGRFYFRVFRYGEYHYALAKENHGPGETESGQRVYRSTDGVTDFERGPLLFRDGARHTAVRVNEHELDVFYSRIGDMPERILHASLDLTVDWMAWRVHEPTTILRPERVWEGVEEPIEPSTAGGIYQPVHELRDPAIFEEHGRTYLLYTVAGERGIAIGELLD